MIKFRGKFKAMLREQIRRGKLNLAPEMTQDALERLMQELSRTPWNVKVYPAYRNGLSVATYLARYIKGGPIGNSRLLSIENGQVRFRYRLSQGEGGDGKQQGIESLPIETFIGRWLQHVPPRRFQTIRGYGLYSGNQHSCLKEAVEAIGGEQVLASCDEGSRSWQDWCEEAGMTDACCCPKCGKRLVSHHEFPSGRAPPVGAFSYREVVVEARIA
jgi:hypothetical protein